MALLWLESFDYYGITPNGGRDNMLLGLWTVFGFGTSSFPEVSADHARTGTYSLKFQNNALANGACAGRRGLTVSTFTCGNAQGFYVNNLPSASNKVGWQLRSTGNTDLATVSLGSDGSFSAYAGGTGGTLLGTSDPNVIQVAAWEHVEIKWNLDNVVGSIEVRVNGEAVLNITNVNLGTTPATQISFGGLANDSGSTLTFYMDDIIVWDATGSHNSDFVGPQRVSTIFPASDAGGNDWTPVGTSPGYNCIDDPVQDGDTTYITSVAAGDVSDFGLGSLPAETTTIIGVFVPALSKLVSAGSGKVQISLVSTGDVAAGPNETITTSYTYHPAIFETDPDTGIAFTKAGLQAASLRIEKTV